MSTLPFPTDPSLRADEGALLAVLGVLLGWASADPLAWVVGVLKKGNMGGLVLESDGERVVALSSSSLAP